MRERIVTLSCECDGEKTHARARAKEYVRGGVREYRFEMQGASYRIRTGGSVLFERRGGLGYRLELDAERPTRARVCTEFGELEVLVRVASLSVREREGLFALRAEYSLDFSGFIQKHSVRFTALSEAKEGGS